MVVADARVNHALRCDLLSRVESLKDTFEAVPPESQAGRTPVPTAWSAPREAGTFTLKLPREPGGRESDPMSA